MCNLLHKYAMLVSTTVSMCTMDTTCSVKPELQHCFLCLRALQAHSQGNQAKVAYVSAYRWQKSKRYGKMKMSQSHGPSVIDFLKNEELRILDRASKCYGPHLTDFWGDKAPRIWKKHTSPEAQKPTWAQKDQSYVRALPPLDKEWHRFGSIYGLITSPHLAVSK